MYENRQVFYNPSIATYVGIWVRECEICIECQYINKTKTILDKIHFPEWDPGPENLKQTDLFPERPPSSGFENNIAGSDVFLTYAWLNQFPASCK